MYIILTRETKCLIILFWKTRPTRRNIVHVGLPVFQEKSSEFLPEVLSNMSIFIIKLARIMFHFRSDC